MHIVEADTTVNILVPNTRFNDGFVVVLANSCAIIFFGF